MAKSTHRLKGKICYSGYPAFLRRPVFQSDKAKNYKRYKKPKFLTFQDQEWLLGKIWLRTWHSRSSRTICFEILSHQTETICKCTENISTVNKKIISGDIIEYNLSLFRKFINRKNSFVNIKTFFKRQTKIEKSHSNIYIIWYINYMVR